MSGSWHDAFLQWEHDRGLHSAAQSVHGNVLLADQGLLQAPTIQDYKAISPCACNAHLRTWWAVRREAERAGLLGGHEGERGGQGAQDEGGEDIVYIQAQLALVAHDPRQ